jgi:membrane protein implicated in regulation of membrane protease activity
VVPLDEAIVNGQGRVQIADALWDVSGRTCRPACPCGSSVSKA